LARKFKIVARRARNCDGGGDAAEAGQEAGQEGGGGSAKKASEKGKAAVEAADGG